MSEKPSNFDDLNSPPTLEDKSRTGNPAYNPAAPAYNPAAPAYNPAAPTYNPAAPTYNPTSNAVYQNDGYNPAVTVVQGNAYEPATQVWTSQPTRVVTVQPTPVMNPPKDGLAFAIIVTFCCCPLIGLFAIMNSSHCRRAILDGDRARAETKADTSRKLSIAALIVGPVLACIYIVLRVSLNTI